MSIVKACVLSVCCNNNAAHVNVAKLARLKKFPGDTMNDCFKLADEHGWRFLNMDIVDKQIALCPKCVKAFQEDM